MQQTHSNPLSATEFRFKGSNFNDQRKQEQKTSNLKDGLEQKETKYAYFDPLSTKVLGLMLVRSAMAMGLTLENELVKSYYDESRIYAQKV